MSSIPTRDQLADMDDTGLERLASLWRAQAGRGDRSAFGIAHELEAERRRRLRDSQMAQLSPEPQAPQRRWWQLWRGTGHGSKPASHI